MPFCEVVHPTELLGEQVSRVSGKTAIGVRQYRYLYLRPDSSLPFYCRPVSLFVLSWAVMLVALSFQISYESYPDMSLPLLLCAMSVIALLCGYYGNLSFADKQSDITPPSHYMVDVKRLRRLNIVMAAVAAVIMLINLKLEGLPPAFGLFSFDTKVYLEYGRFKQLLFPLLICLVVNSSLDPSRLRKSAMWGFGLLSMLLYITRGGVLGALLQTFFVFSMTTKINRRKLLLYAVSMIVMLIILADVIGNNRTTQIGFLHFLEIRSQFWDWPMPALWVISYFSIPLSNLCWIVRTFHFHAPTLGFLYPAFPAFIAPADPHEAFIFGSSHVIDNVHTYLAPYFMDFSYAGIVLVNAALGVLCAVVVRRGITKSVLLSAILLGCMADIFFNDNFIPLSTSLQVCIQWVAQRYIFSSDNGVPVRRSSRAS